MKWFRVYAEIKDDPKVLELDFEQRWLWLSLLAMASDSSERGVVTFVRMRGLAASLRCDETTLTTALELLADLDMIEVGDGRITITHWEDRQYDKPSDAPEATRDRKRRSRARHAVSRESGVTEQDVTPTESDDLAASRSGHADVTPSHATDTDTESDTDPEKKTGAARPVPAEDTPFSLFEALMDLVGTPGRKPPSPAWRDKQLGIAKRLLEQGHSADQVRKCIAFMQSQSWRGSPIDLGQVERVIDAWEVSGEPERDTSRGRSTRQPDAEDGVKRRGYSYDAVTRAASGY